MFIVGQSVKWQARFGTAHTGTVVAVVPPGVMPCDVVSVHYRHWIRQICFDMQKTRNHESYIIETPTGKRGGKRSAYRPLVRNLKIA